MPPIDLSNVRVGMTRDEVVAVFGEPDDMGVTSRKYKTPSVYLYGRIEFYFESRKSGGLTWVQEVDESGEHLRRLFPQEI
jgi:hypothetical protein